MASLLIRALTASLLLNVILLAILGHDNSKKQSKKSVYQTRGMIFI
jgi:hypothetical protein